MLPPEIVGAILAHLSPRDLYMATRAAMFLSSALHGEGRCVRKFMLKKGQPIDNVHMLLVRYGIDGLSCPAVMKAELEEYTKPREFVQELRIFNYGDDQKRVCLHTVGTYPPHYDVPDVAVQIMLRSYRWYQDCVPRDLLTHWKCAKISALNAMSDPKLAEELLITPFVKRVIAWRDRWTSFQWPNAKVRRLALPFMVSERDPESFAVLLHGSSLENEEEVRQHCTELVYAA